MEKRRKEIKKLSDQRISMAIQRGKAACISSAMRPDGADLHPIYCIYNLLCT